MSQRPEALWPLFAELKTLDGVGPKTAQAMEGLDVVAPRDLLLTLPHSVIDRRPRPSVQGADLPGTVTVEVEGLRHMPPAVKGRPYRIQVEDAETTFQLVFFHGRCRFYIAEFKG